MVEIRVKDDMLIAFANDWNSLTRNEKKFFSKCYFYAIWTGFDADGNLIMQHCESASKKIRVISNAIKLAKPFEIAVSSEVEDLLGKLREAAKTDEERVCVARERELLRLRWQNRKKSGCELCEYRVQKGDAWFECAYSGDTLDTRIGEHWDGLNGVYEIFHEDGEPNEHCKDFYQESIVKKDGGNYGKI